MPILINENTTSNLTLTLKEKTTLSTPVYLFQFRNVTEKVSYYCIMADTSLYKDRYNEFVFTEGTDNPLLGELILGAGGQYEYFVYEQTSATNLDPTLATGLSRKWTNGLRTCKYYL